MECWIVFLRIEKFYLFQRSFVRIDILFCCFDFLLKGGSRIVEQFGKLIPSFGSEGTSAEGAFIISVTIVYHILFCCFDFLLKGGSRIVEQFGKLIPSFGSEGTSAEGAFIISVTIVYLHSFFGECLFLWVVADFRKLYGRSNCFC